MADWPYNTSKWQRLRLAKLSHDPLCHACTLRGEVTVASAVDHMKSVASGGAPFPSLDQLMSLCARCHNEKTNAIDRSDRHGSGRRFKGFDAEGNPIDPADDWHGGALNRQKKPNIGPMGNMKIYLVSDPTDEESEDDEPMVF